MVMMTIVLNLNYVFVLIPVWT